MMRKKALILNHSNASLTQMAMSEYKLGRKASECVVKDEEAIALRYFELTLSVFF